MTSDYVFIRKSRNAFSSFLHVAFNILFGLGAVLATIVSGSWLLGFALVLLSKWRMFAVRPHYLLLNLKSNLVDLIVGFSVILLTYFSGTEYSFVHTLLQIFYVSWLVFIKPRTSETWNLIQSLIAIFLGTCASVALSANLNSLVLVLLEFFIGYSATRHILVQHSSQASDHGFPSLICGLIFAEIALLAHSWLIVYVFTSQKIMIPSLAIILTLVGFTFFKVHESLEAHEGKIRLKDVAPPIVFSLIVIAIIIFRFSEPIFNI